MVGKLHVAEFVSHDRTVSQDALRHLEDRRVHGSCSSWRAGGGPRDSCVWEDAHEDVPAVKGVGEDRVEGMNLEERWERKPALANPFLPQCIARPPRGRLLRHLLPLALIPRVTTPASTNNPPARSGSFVPASGHWQETLAFAVRQMGSVIFTLSFSSPQQSLKGITSPSFEQCLCLGFHNDGRKSAFSAGGARRPSFPPHSKQQAPGRVSYGRPKTEGPNKACRGPDPSLGSNASPSASAGPAFRRAVGGGGAPPFRNVFKRESFCLSHGMLNKAGVSQYAARTGGGYSAISISVDKPISFLIVSHYVTIKLRALFCISKQRKGRRGGDINLREEPAYGFRSISPD
ncbi:hypothetical protein SKAU_G00373910 [Synaphobranchus kaupii]|uniref:Uncharacterized protein n=1 Tax=Synaphobranchus kaupii TaxID=118154 RepID=A0A9Q1EGK2_SYNKA|nr:hypothetical protein SKAU_G00373910 [Synaphobranchus kaupii]